MTPTTPYFDRLLAEHGDSPRALDWSAEGQRERFRVLCDVGIGAADSVLDVGCGLGHFLSFLRDRRRFGGYVGIDASAAMIDRCCQGGARIGAEFNVIDALGPAPLPVADYVVASGVLNVETGTNEPDARRLIHACWDACREAVAINFLSAFAPTKRPDRHYFDPSKMLRAAMGVTPHVVLRHDYRDNDFTLYLYRERRQ